MQIVFIHFYELKFGDRNTLVLNVSGSEDEVKDIFFF